MLVAEAARKSLEKLGRTHDIAGLIRLRHRRTTDEGMYSGSHDDNYAGDPHLHAIRRRDVAVAPRELDESGPRTINSALPLLSGEDQPAIGGEPDAGSSTSGSRRAGAPRTSSGAGSRNRRETRGIQTERLIDPHQFR
jgi:hypothetical protein